MGHFRSICGEQVPPTPRAQRLGRPRPILVLLDFALARARMDEDRAAMPKALDDGGGILLPRG